MSTGLIEIMKRAALDANENAKPTDLRYGQVVSINPLRVQITTQFTIPQSMLVIPKRLIDSDPLMLNDRVALLRQSGGQSYFILDKI